MPAGKDAQGFGGEEGRKGPTEVRANLPGPGDRKGAVPLTRQLPASPGLSRFSVLNPSNKKLVTDAYEMPLQPLVCDSTSRSVS